MLRIYYRKVANDCTDSNLDFGDTCNGHEKCCLTGFLKDEFLSRLLSSCFKDKEQTDVFFSVG